MLEVNCNNCPNLINKVDGCRLYGAIPATAAEACARDGFKNASVKPRSVEHDKEEYFLTRFYCPICGEFLASYDYGRSWTDNGLSKDRRINCPDCGQKIDWSGVPLPTED